MEAARRWWNSTASGAAPSTITTASPADSEAELDDTKNTADAEITEVEKHDDLSDPAKPAHHRGRCFVNPWPSAVVRNATWIPSFQIPFAWAGTLHPDVKRVEVVKPDFDKTAGPHDIKATWLGHAGMLVQLPPLAKDAKSVTFAVDPIFSTRSSPSQYAGPARRLPAPCTVHDLPHIDFLLISHNHYDHLDSTTVEALIQRSGKTMHYVVPLGLKAWFLACKVPEEQITELDWWDEATFLPDQIGDRSEELNKKGSVRISCVPAQHNSARTGIDKCTTLWAGFVVEQFANESSPAPKRTSVYLAGDTGYRADAAGPVCPAFKAIGAKYGPIDLSAIPIWRGGTLSFISSWGLRLHPEALTRSTHATPQDAVAIHKDVNSQASIAIHFATFSGSEDEATYPVALLEEECVAKGLPTSLRESFGFAVTNVGETMIISAGKG